MDDMDDYDFNETKRTIADSLRHDLLSVTQEEKQLLQLRNQMSKIKKIREDQIKKDTLITSLREQIAIYDHERATTNRQNAELQQIMAERINILERHLYEKESIEIQYSELKQSYEVIQTERKHLEELLLQETKRSETYKGKYEKVRQQYHHLSEDLQKERELTEQVRQVMESIRTETEAKETTLSNLKIHSTIVETELQEKVSTLTQSYEELQRKNRLLEESMKISEKTSETNWQTIESLQRELFEAKKEVSKYQKLYEEVDARYLVLHTQAEALKSSQYVEDIHSLREEKSSLQRQIHLRASEVEAIRTVVGYVVDVLREVSAQVTPHGDTTVEQADAEKIHEAINRLFLIRNQAIECGLESFAEVNHLLKYLSMFFHKYLTVREANYFQYLSSQLLTVQKGSSLASTQTLYPTTATTTAVPAPIPPIPSVFSSLQSDTSLNSNTTTIRNISGSSHQQQHQSSVSYHHHRRSQSPEHHHHSHARHSAGSPHREHSSDRQSGHHKTNHHHYAPHHNNPLDSTLFASPSMNISQLSTNTEQIIIKAKRDLEVDESEAKLSPHRDRATSRSQAKRTSNNTTTTTTHSSNSSTSSSSSSILSGRRQEEAKLQKLQQELKEEFPSPATPPKEEGKSSDRMVFMKNKATNTPPDATLATGTSRYPQSHSPPTGSSLNASFEEASNIFKKYEYFHH